MTKEQILIDMLRKAIAVIDEARAQMRIDYPKLFEGEQNEKS